MTKEEAWAAFAEQYNHRLHGPSDAFKFAWDAATKAERDCERGFIDGMQKQMQSSVDKAVNAMSQRTWVGLTPEERDNFWKADQMTSKEWEELFEAIEAKLKEKNT